MRRLALVALILLVTSCTPGPQETGTLEGHVTIGPLVPVAREGEPEPTPRPEVYASRQIVIYAQDGRTEITRVQFDGKGNYRVTLPVGTYVVDINHVGIDHGIDLPKTVEILSRQVTRLDVEIDTGIR
jgi:hypothetical protein